MLFWFKRGTWLIRVRYAFFLLPAHNDKLGSSEMKRVSFYSHMNFDSNLERKPSHFSAGARFGIRVAVKLDDFLIEFDDRCFQKCAIGWCETPVMLWLLKQSQHIFRLHRNVHSRRMLYRNAKNRNSKVSQDRVTGFQYTICFRVNVNCSSGRILENVGHLNVGIRISCVSSSHLVYQMPLRSFDLYSYFSVLFSSVLFDVGA